MLAHLTRWLVATLACVVYLASFAVVAQAQCQPEQQKTLSEDLACRDLFGTALSVKGEVALIGAAGDDDRGSESGSAYVFHFDGTAWIQEQKLLAADGESRDFFGIAVDLDWPVAVVGAHWDDDRGEDAGAAYVFRWNGSSWLQEQKLVSKDAGLSDFFGYSVALNGDVALIGAYNHGYAGRSAGTALVFRRDGGTWHEIHRLIPTDTRPGQTFGYAASLDWPTAIVGVWLDDSASPSNWNCDSGAAYVWQLDEYAALWQNYGAGWPGTNGVPSLTLSGVPYLGISQTLMIENSRPPQQTVALIVVGESSALIDTPLGGTLLVNPSLLIPIVISGSVVALPFAVPDDCGFLGVAIYSQTLEHDPGASKGVSFTPGLELVLGY
ncbi:MAG: hypothetical protein AB1486_07890 [Planctomycetota bacterium]